MKEIILFFPFFFEVRIVKKKKLIKFKVRFDGFSVRIMRKLSEMLNEIKCHYCNKKNNKSQKSEFKKNS